MNESKVIDLNKALEFLRPLLDLELDIDMRISFGGRPILPEHRVRTEYYEFSSLRMDNRECTAIVNTLNSMPVTWYFDSPDGSFSIHPDKSLFENSDK